MILWRRGWLAPSVSDQIHVQVVEKQVTNEISVALRFFILCRLQSNEVSSDKVVRDPNLLITVAISLHFFMFQSRQIALVSYPIITYVDEHIN